MWVLYTIAMQLYGLGIRLADPFSAKARLWVSGRSDWERKLQDALQYRQPGQPLIWMHCASLGEFEQGRPVLEDLRRGYPDHFLVLSFFSPSGYEIRKDYGGVDAVVYLPLDTPGNARRWQDILQPDLLILVKYEFWYHHLRIAQERGVPCVLISARFRAQQLFFKPYGKAFRSVLAGFTHLFTQDEASAKIAGRYLDTQKIHVAGDTRVDRVLTLARQATVLPDIERFVGERPCLVVGSSWPPDEKILHPFLGESLPANWCVLLAPHDISERHLQDIEAGLPLSYQRYSMGIGGPDSRILLIDNIGMLSRLYQYGKLAYIGGGFGAGIHNTLEPIAFGLPVLFGPRYGQFQEAHYLLREGGARCVCSSQELAQAFTTWQDQKAWQQASTAARSYIEQHQGASRTILELLRQQAMLPA